MKYTPATYELEPGEGQLLAIEVAPAKWNRMYKPDINKMSMHQLKQEQNLLLSEKTFSAYVYKGKKKRADTYLTVIHFVPDWESDPFNPGIKTNFLWCTATANIVGTEEIKILEKRAEAIFVNSPKYPDFLAFCLQRMVLLREIKTLIENRQYQEANR